MTELPSIPRSGSETESLDGFLDYQRAVIARKVEGLTPGQLTHRLEPSTLTLGGIIQHLTEVERWWFREVFAGEPDLSFLWSADDPDGDFRVEGGTSAEQLVAGYRAEIGSCRAAIAGRQLDAMAANPPRGREVSLRWILVHMIEETARHAGHADLLREAIDGSTGD